MGLESNVAVVALVVSLIALLIALLQLSQQLLGTSEGYRRCNASMLGPWSALRWRKIILSELRFETHFETPHITLGELHDEENAEWPHTSTKRRRNRENSSLIFPLDANRIRRDPGLPPPVHASRRFWRKLAQSLRRPSHKERWEVLYSIAAAADSRNTISAASGTSFEIRERDDGSGNIDDDAEKALGPPLKLHRNLAPVNELTVSWIALLQVLLLLQDRSWTRDVSACNIWPDKRTGARIRFSPYVWDLLPTDVQKPLATSDVGTIAVLVVRLGMRWRSLQPHEGKMAADGHGFVLSAVSTRGLGIVLNLRIVGDHYPSPAFIQSDAVDALICGIIPRCAALMREDHRIVSDEGKIKFKETVVKQIGAEYNDSWESNNEVLILLCDFLPLRGDRLVCYPAFAKTGLPAGRSTMIWWEGRYALLNESTKRAKTFHCLTEVRDHFQTLERDHGAYFFNENHRLSKAKFDPDIDSHTRSQKQVDLANACRDIFDWTTEVLKQLHYDDLSPDGTNTFYVCLVAAHYRLSHECVGLHRNLQDRQRDRWNARLPSRWLAPAARLRIGSDDVYQMVVENSQHLTTDEDWSILRALKARGKVVDKEEAEYAWWLLMLRGVAWTLSVEPVYEVEPLPASMYRNPTQVWIT